MKSMLKEAESREKFLELVAESIKKQLKEQITKLLDRSDENRSLPDDEAIVCFENLDMSSSQYGHRVFMTVGPARTYTLEDVKQDSVHLGEVPSQFLHPVQYWRCGNEAQEKAAKGS